MQTQTTRTTQKFVTARQYAVAAALAAWFSHGWAEALPMGRGTVLPDPQTNVKPVRLSLIVEEGLKADPNGLVPVMDEKGNLTHTTGTGRTRWVIEPSGMLRVFISRQGNESCAEMHVDTREKQVREAYVTPQARFRHLEALFNVLNGLCVLGIDVRAQLAQRGAPFQRTFEIIEALEASTAQYHADMEDLHEHQQAALLVGAVPEGTLDAHTLVLRDGGTICVPFGLLGAIEPEYNAAHDAIEKRQAQRLAGIDARIQVFDDAREQFQNAVRKVAPPAKTETGSRGYFDRAQQAFEARKKARVEYRKMHAVQKTG